jgi:hypothetical protein
MIACRHDVISYDAEPRPVTTNSFLRSASSRATTSRQSSPPVSVTSDQSLPKQHGAGVVALERHRGGAVQKRRHVLGHVRAPGSKTPRA